MGLDACVGLPLVVTAQITELHSSITGARRERIRVLERELNILNRLRVVRKWDLILLP